MDPPAIVEVEVPGQNVAGLLWDEQVMPLDFFVLHGMPQVFVEDVLERTEERERLDWL